MKKRLYVKDLSSPLLYMEDKARIIDRAQRYVQKGYLDKAISEYQKVFKIDPKDVTTHLRVGDLYIRMGNREEAVKGYAEGARILTQKGFYLKAIAVYKQVLKLDETLLDIHCKLAELYSRQGLIADAIAEYSYLVNYYEKSNRIDEVLSNLERMVEIDPKNTGIRLKLADTLYKRGFKKEAFTQYDEVLKGLLAGGDLYKAERIYRGLYDLNPGEPEVLEALIVIYRRRGDKEQLLKAYRELGSIYRSRGQDAKEVYEGILEISPQDREALEVLGRGSPPIEVGTSTEEVVEPPESLGEGPIELVPEEVIEVVEEISPAEEAPIPASSAGGEEGEVDLSQALGLEEALDFLTGSWVSKESRGEEAFTEFKRGMERQLSEEDAETHYNLGIAYMEMELYDEAIREFKIALKDPGMAFGCYTLLGLCYRTKGETQEAIDQFLKGMMMPSITREERRGLLYELGLTYEKAGKLQEALEVFRTVAGMDPDFREVSSKVEGLSRRVHQGIPKDDGLIL